MIAASDVRFLTVLSEYRATFSGSNSLKARRYPSRFLSTVDQLSPACADSSTRNSKCVRSSWTGTPHSRSWYDCISRSFPLTQWHRLGSFSLIADLTNHAERRAPFARAQLAPRTSSPGTGRAYLERLPKLWMIGEL